MSGAAVACRVGGISENRKTRTPPPDIPGFPKDWRDQIKADLADQLAAGGTLYGARSDGAYIARTRDGDRVLKVSERRSA